MEISKAPYVLVTTKHRGVFAGFLVEDKSPNSVSLADARCAIRFGTTQGFMQLAETGPTKNSRIGAKAPHVRLFDITSITQITEEAKSKWETA